MDQKWQRWLWLGTLMCLWLIAGNPVFAQNGDGAIWTRVADNFTDKYAIAYDSNRARTVLYTGSYKGVFEWTGHEWLARPSSNSPAERQDCLMSYDAARGRIVLFGGSYFNQTTHEWTYYNDTWEWDGENWIQCKSTQSPPTRLEAAMVYDANRMRIVLFGGALNNTVYGDTWEWDGVNWTKKNPVSSPIARHEHALTYDRSHKRIVLFGGIDQAGNYLNDTWEWDGAAWQRKETINAPAGGSRHTLGYDQIRDRVILYGGYGQNGNLSDTSEWDGSSWSQDETLLTPAIGDYYGLSDPVGNGRVSLFSKKNNFNIWEWDGAQWVHSLDGDTPAPRKGHVMVFDNRRNEMVLFGGQIMYIPPSGPLNETWAWDGSLWHQRDPVSKPSALTQSAACYDSARGRTVLFGGEWFEVTPKEIYSRVYAETWEWDGENWQKMTPTISPVKRLSAAMAYDENRHRSVLFGGITGNDTGDILRDTYLLNDTWEWNGTQWLQCSPAHSPTPRSDHSIVYDKARQCILLTGGADPNETWRWDGADWTLLHPAHTPPAGIMTYDATLQRVVLYPGSKDLGLWAWDGSDWTSEVTANMPPSRNEHAIAYDELRHCLLLFGGDPSAFLFDTWILFNKTGVKHWQRYE